ncbi:MAG: hypothetical protein CYPHOPRED_004199 [Cyphobasidiales sp. Tagirdzhanova-0007]|nr:MAG: hypothetical protein CYPHOPRED_004199 [Cyphobasidiales sp. Tagirdzhanova-0007]
MKVSFTLASLGTISVALAQQTLFINTPVSLVQCLPSIISFGGGVAPYYLSVLPAGAIAAVPIEYLTVAPTETNHTWFVDLPAGTNITMAIRDSVGALNYASPIAVQTSGNSTCLNATASAVAVSEGALIPTSSASHRKRLF